MTISIAADHLCRRFGNLRAVDDISFVARQGEVLGFLGPNGAGKSTTMKMITGFLAPTAGTARVGSADVGREPLAAKRQIGYLPEGAPAYADMTPAGFLHFVAAVRGFHGAEARRRVDEVMERVHLGEVAQQPVETLSKGFKRRVGLAQAILHDPPALILDEPTDGLDPNQKHEVRELIRAMARDKVIILSTHILEEVDAVCTRALIIARGRIIADGTPEELEQRSPRHNAVRLGIAGATDAAPLVQALRGLAGVADVEVLGSDAGVLIVRVLPESGAHIAPRVSELARDRGWQLEELHVEHGRLDEVFRNLTQGQPA